jgi:hypothetical protein
MVTFPNGLSRAKVRIGETFVRKTGLGCREQAARILTHWHPHLPLIHSLLPDGYVMERLAQPPAGMAYEEPVLEVLSRFFWRQIHPVVPQWRSELEVFLSPQPVLLKNLLALYPNPRPSGQSGRVIHGDPTRANTLLRRSDGRETLVLIDPIMPVGKVPSLQEVDMGKILQSQVGWETFLDTGEISSAADTLTALWKFWVDKCALYADTWHAHMPDLIWEKVFFWGAVHHARILPYINNREDLSVDQKDLLYSYCMTRIKEIQNCLC